MSLLKTGNVMKKQRTRLWVSRLVMLKSGCTAFLMNGQLYWALPNGEILSSISEYDMELDLKDRRSLDILQQWMHKNSIRFEN